jgi:hypothetical protein
MNLGRFFDVIARVDSIVNRGNVKDAFSELQDLLSDSSVRKYFFENLHSADWLLPLAEGGFFDSPPRVKRDPGSNTVEFPVWTESGYLSRMASLAPEQVLEVILRIPDTDNAKVNEDLADAALKIPAEFSACLSEKATTWARSRYQFLMPKKLGALMGHLAKGGKVKEALQLGRVLLEISAEPIARATSEPEETHSIPREPKARFEIWQYERILKEYFPEVVNAAGIQALGLLCDLLERAILLSQGPGETEAPEDYSYVWRPAVEDHAQNIAGGVKGTLVSGVRDAGVSLVKSNPTSTREIIRLLEERPWLIFHRIALHLLTRFPSAAPELVAARLTDRALFDDSGARHEYAIMLGDCLDHLTDEQQTVILGWIEAGPDIERFKETQEQWDGKQPADTEVERYRKIWQRDRLAWLKTQLPEEWKHRYEALVAECGEPEHPEFVSYTTSWVGPTSPKNAEELQGMAVADIVGFLKVWSSSEDRMAPSPEGLGRELSSVVSENPGRFAVEAVRFRGLDPTYVRALFSGFRNALKQKRTFDWYHVLGLCSWVVNQPREIPGRKTRALDADPDWGGTRKAIADLLSVGFDEAAGSIPTEHRVTVWNILRPLTEDPDPTPEHEAKYGGSTMDPATLSLNTTRGEAMHALVRYALWIRRLLETLPEATSRIGRGLEEMPEVRATLDEHLSVSRDPSLAVRAVYGQWFPWLVLLDPDWARTQVSRIFSDSVSEHKFRDAAWQTYIIFNQPYNNVFDMLRDQYRAAVLHLDEAKGETRLLADPDERLARHLMTFYWRGKLDVREPEGLFAKFWARASDKLRGYALGSEGRALHETKDPIPPEILARLRELWESRLETARGAPSPQDYREEMAAFGWWFVSEKFDDRWSLANLTEALHIAKKIEPDHLVVERLAALAGGRPLEAVRCLGVIVEADVDGWGIYGWREQAREVLEVATRDSAARPAAEEIIHYLGSRGYFEFRELLQRG